MNVFEEIRKEYESTGLDLGDLAEHPMDQFGHWFQEAVKRSPGPWYEPNAMTLSTCAGDFVTSRTVLLKEYDRQQCVFFTNYVSEKGRQIDTNSNVALLFHWHYLGRQVRIAGSVTKTSREQSEKYFHSRPRGSQIGAFISEQSSELESREKFESRYKELDGQYAGQEIPLPETWGGYCLRPSRLEFWQGRLNRLHDRFQYRLEGQTANQDGGAANWVISRLYP